MGQVRYDDHKLIVNVFTKEHGWLPFMMRSSRKGTRSALFQPWSLVELHYALRENREIQTPAQWNLALIPVRTGSDVRRSALAMFFAEVLGKTLHKEYVNTDLFERCRQLAIDLEQSESIAPLPIQFLLGLADAYGFELEYPETESLSFDPIKGGFVPMNRACSASLNTADSLVLAGSIQAMKLGIVLPAVPTLARNRVIRALILYLQERLGMHRPIESLSVLETVFHA